MTEIDTDYLSLFAAIQGMDRSKLENLKQDIEERLAELPPDLAAPAPTSSREVVERRWTPRVCYQLERVRCGKERCRKCSQGTGHGPYWYSYQWIEGRQKSTYHGKFPPPQLSYVGQVDQHAPGLHKTKQDTFEGRSPYPDSWFKD